MFSDLDFSNSSVLLCHPLQGEPHSATKPRQSSTSSSYIGREVFWQLCLPFDGRIFMNLMQKLIALLLAAVPERINFDIKLLLGWSHIPWSWCSRWFPLGIKHEWERGTGRAFSTWGRRRRKVHTEWYTQREYFISKRITDTLVLHRTCLW